MWSEFSIKIGDVIVLIVVVPVIENALGIFTLKRSENDDIGCHASLSYIDYISFLNSFTLKSHLCIQLW